MNLGGIAENWYGGFVEEGIEMTWFRFVEEIMARFEDDLNLNPIAELKILHQTTTVDEYIVKFEDLKGWALMRNKEFNENFFIDCFIRGLREDIRLGIQDTEFPSLTIAIRKARNEEAKVEAWIKRSKNVNRMSTYVNSNHKSMGDGKLKEREEVSVNKGKLGVLTKNNSFFKNYPIKYLTKGDDDDRRKRWVCYI